jgi:hypothetical protein
MPRLITVALTALLLCSSAPSFVAARKPTGPRKRPPAKRQPHPRLTLKVEHLPTQPCGGVCGLVKGKLNKLRFTLSNRSREALQVGWRYSCSGFSSLLVTVRARKRGSKPLWTHNFGAQRACTRNGLMLRPLAPKTSRSVVLSWKLPVGAAGGRSPKPAIYRLVAELRVVERRAKGAKGAKGRTSHVTLRAEALFPVH